MPPIDAADRLFVTKRPLLHTYTAALLRWFSGGVNEELMGVQCSTTFTPARPVPVPSLKPQHS